LPQPQPQQPEQRGSSEQIRQQQQQSSQQQLQQIRQQQQLQQQQQKQLSQQHLQQQQQQLTPQQASQQRLLQAWVLPPPPQPQPQPPQPQSPQQQQQEQQQQVQLRPQAHEPSPPAHTEEPAELAPSVEVAVGTHRLRILDILGSGSYSVVWRAEVISVDAKDGGRQPVALKDVHCKTPLSLQQTLFEIQLLMASEMQSLEKAATKDAIHRLPLCLSHSVTQRGEGWNVRCVMNILPGEQLDQWLYREAEAAVVAAKQAAGVQGGSPRRAVTWASHLGRGCALARALVVQLAPTLERLSPMAFHRDINSHNVLVGGCGTSFWLCDLGLAADAKAWPTEGTAEGAQGAWKVTDIGGDCRYWPPSCWMVHCHGTEYLESRPEFCQQYQWRLDVHGLGITAIEVLCSTALAAYNCEAIGGLGAEMDGPWGQLLAAWSHYRDVVGQWWERIYAVFSEGGDLRPVHAWLTENQVAEQTIALLAELHKALQACAAATDEATSRLLLLLRDLTTETSSIGLRDAYELLHEAPQDVLTPRLAMPVPAAWEQSRSEASVRNAGAPPDGSGGLGRLDEDIFGSSGISSSTPAAGTAPTSEAASVSAAAADDTSSSAVLDEEGASALEAASKACARLLEHLHFDDTQASSTENGSSCISTGACATPPTAPPWQISPAVLASLTGERSPSGKATALGPGIMVAGYAHIVPPVVEGQ